MAVTESQPLLWQTIENDCIKHNNPDKDNESHTSSFTKRYVYIGYIFLLLIIGLESGSLITAQLALSKSSVFELSIIRFAFQTVVSFVLVVTKRASFKISTSHWLLILGASVLDYVYAVGTYTAASFLPVGSVQGVSMSLYIVFTVFVDIVRRLAHRTSLICAVIACTGIMLLAQPWNFTLHAKKANPCAACDILDGLHPFNGTCRDDINHINHTTYSNLTANYQIFTAPLSNSTDGKSSWHDLSSSWSHSHLFGYLLVVVSALSASISSNCCHKLVSMYYIPSVTFWTAFMEFLLTLTINTIIKDTTGQEWALPTGTYCLTFALTFAIITGVSDFMWYFAFSFIPVSHVSLGSTPTVVILYISQKTFLKNFYPGYSNYLEPIGAVLAFTGSACMPVFHMCCHKGKSN